MGLVLCGAAAAAQGATNRLTASVLAQAGTAALPAPALQPGVARVYTRADGGLSMRMADGSTAYAWPTAYGYTVSFPANARGVEIWTRTQSGWSVTQTRRKNTAAALRTPRGGSARLPVAKRRQTGTVRRIR
jgi:hypothetical protein